MANNYVSNCLTFRANRKDMVGRTRLGAFKVCINKGTETKVIFESVPFIAFQWYNDCFGNLTQSKIVK